MKAAPSNRRLPREEGSEPAVEVSVPKAASPRKAQAVAFLRWVLGVSVLIGLGGGLAFLLERYAHTSPRFALRDIDIVGAEHRTKDEIVKKSGLVLGANLFSLDVEAARTALLTDPWIEEVEWLRRLPGTVEFRVKERRAAMLVALPELFLATADGVPFKRLEAGDPSDFPVLTGLNAELATGDATQVKAKVQAALELALEYDRNPVHAIWPLQEVHLTPEGRMSLVVGKSGLEVHLGARPYRRKIEEVRRVAYELGKRGGEPRAIYVDNDGRPERVVVRLR